MKGQLVGGRISIGFLNTNVLHFFRLCLYFTPFLLPSPSVLFYLWRWEQLGRMQSLRLWVSEVSFKWEDFRGIPELLRILQDLLRTVMAGGWMRAFLLKPLGTGFLCSNFFPQGTAEKSPASNCITISQEQASLFPPNASPLLSLQGLVMSAGKSSGSYSGS